VTDEPENLPDYYPGSKTRRKKYTEPKPQQVYEPVELGKSRMFRLDGKNVECFSSGTLAAALGRKAVTIRKWEQTGIIPKARLMTYGRDGDAGGPPLVHPQPGGDNDPHSPGREHF
jgi:hypothetical protein